MGPNARTPVVIPPDYLDACPYCDGPAEAVGRKKRSFAPAHVQFYCLDCEMLYARGEAELRFLIEGFLIEWRDGAGPHPPPPPRGE